VTTPTLTSYLESLPDEGDFSMWAGPLQGPPVVEHNAQVRHYAASTMKVALVIAAYRSADARTLDLDKAVTVHNDFASVVPGERFSMDRTEDSDDQTWQRMGQDVALRWLASRAIVRSGNLAANLLLDAVGLPAVAETLQVIGAKNSVVTRGIEDSAGRLAGNHNLVTAEDLALTLQGLTAHRVAAHESCNEILAILAAQQINDAIPAGLPPGTRVAHKSGWVDGVSHDAGIIYPGDGSPYILAVCTTSKLDEQQGLELIANAARASWIDRQALA